MPRFADHDQRREQMARAFQRLLASDGLARVTFARVAAEAGISVGLIQHYFDGKDALLRFAYADCLRRIDTRIATRIEAGEAAHEPISTMLLDCLRELLPLDAERTIEFRVERTLWTAAFTDESLATIAARATADTHRRIAAAIDNGKHCGEVDTTVDSTSAATMILATTRGLADALGLAPSPGTSVADATLRPPLALVFTGECRYHER
ncbi:TetR family transcriptional regulator [Nocardia otitidiscaviarum]|uniref:TetR family transcriptional regulator n=1 Tax=Nocardia otitidiscaviarum TaxID=1823 RepID=A0A516NJN2_9NOCA|nr:TetR/AcrR family transcriptional regulator [Nocardia otitidiscaviarum]MCP9618880.1 TetR/AcrR family transcriptional regulator [Nocardia otitidiscaviarum]QDP79113.1 TetR family transcriptional regulator [Nocardia otitidiscaviarum]